MSVSISDYTANDRKTPPSGGRYIILEILFAIPIIGWIYWIIKMFSPTTNIHERNFARSKLYWLLLYAIFFLIWYIDLHNRAGVPLNSPADVWHSLTLEFNTISQAFSKLFIPAFK